MSLLSAHSYNMSLDCKVSHMIAHLNRCTKVIHHYRGRPWRYSVIPSSPDFPTEYQIHRNSNPAGLPVFAAIWGPDFKASIIILTNMIKQITITMFKVYPSPANALRWSVGNDSEHRTRVIDVGLLFILRLASRLVLWAWQVRLFTYNLDNCNEVNSRLPHRAHISKVSCSEAICRWVNIYKHPTGFCFDCATNFECWHPGTFFCWRLAKNKHSSCKHSLFEIWCKGV